MDTEIEQWSDEERLAAAAIHGAVLFGFAGFAPIVVYALYKDKNPVLGERAKKAILVQFVALAILIVVSMVTCGFGALLIFPWFGYELYLAIMSYQGQSKGYPV